MTTREQAEEQQPDYVNHPDDVSPEQRAYEEALPEPKPVKGVPF